MATDPQKSTTSDSDLVLDAQAGNDSAFELLVGRWFDGAWNVSMSILRDADSATEATQATFAAALSELGRLEPGAAFGPWVLRSSRSRSLESLENQQRATPLPAEIAGEWKETNQHPAADLERLRNTTDLSSARAQQSLVWAVAAALGDKDASILDLHLRHELSASDLEDELGRSDAKARQSLRRLKKRLGDAIGNYLLWNDGSPSCEQLDQRVEAEVAFGRSTHNTVRDHQKTCTNCADRRQKLSDPEQLFSAVAMFVVPPKLKAKALRELGFAEIEASTQTNPLALFDTDSSNVAIPDATEPASLTDAELDPNQTHEHDQNEIIQALPADTKPNQDDTHERQQNEGFQSLSERPELDRSETRPAKPFSDSTEPAYAQDPPVRTRRSHPRSPITEAPESKFEKNRPLAVAASAVVLVTAICLLALFRSSGDNLSVDDIAAPLATDASAQQAAPNPEEASIEPVTDDPQADDPHTDDPDTDEGEHAGDATNQSDSDTGPQVTAATPNSDPAPQEQTTTTESPVLPSTTVGQARVSPVNIPSIQGLLPPQGVAALRIRGLETTVEMVPASSPDRVGKIRDTLPRSGSAVERGTVVKIFVYM